MKKVSKKQTITLKYFKGKNAASEGSFAGGVVDPKYLNEIQMWVERAESFDFNEDNFIPTGGMQVNLAGSRRALFELGKYLIAISRYQTADAGYHDHFEGIGSGPSNIAETDLIVHAPSRLKNERDGKRDMS